MPLGSTCDIDRAAMHILHNAYRCFALEFLPLHPERCCRFPCRISLANSRNSAARCNSPAVAMAIANVSRRITVERMTCPSCTQRHGVT